VSTAPFIELRSDANRDVVVRVSFERTPDTRADGFHVEVDAPGLSVHETVVSWKGDGLESFFASLADDWKGWHGTRAWHALEDEMIIEASHGGRFVELQFTLRRENDESDDWELRLPILLAPGESLTRAAADIKSLFR